MKKILFIIALAFTVLSCEKLPEAPTSPLKMAVDRTTVDIYPDVPATVNFTVENYEGKNVNYSLSPLNKNIDAVINSTTDGTGSITFSMKNDSESQTKYTLTATTNQRTGDIETASCEILVCSYSPEPQEGLSFDDGTKTKAFKFMDSERVFTFGLNWGPDDLKVVVSDEAKDWCKAVITDRKTLNIWLAANEGASIRRGFVTVNDKVTVSFEQYGAKMEGSLGSGLMAFYNALQGSSWENIHHWGKSGNYAEWDGISADSTMTLTAFGSNKEVYCGTDDLWNIRFPNEYWAYGYEIDGVVPQAFWDIANYFRRIDLSGTQATVEGLPENAFHSELVEFCLVNNTWNTSWNGRICVFGSGGNFDQIYNCPKLEKFSIINHRAFGTLDDRLLSLKNLKVLDILGNYTSGYIPENIGNLSNLEVFSLGGYIDFDLEWNYIPYQLGYGSYETLGCFTQYWTGKTLPESFYNLERLRSIRICCLPLIGGLSPKIGNLKNLEEIDIYEVPFTEEIPEVIGSLKSLVSFNYCTEYSKYPEFLRYWPSEDLYFYPEGWYCSDIDLPSNCSYYMDNYYVTPKWYYERFGSYVGHTISKHPCYPYADDLQYPADEYYFDGKDWKHPNYDHPARYYHKVNGEWIYDPDWDWTADDEHQTSDPPHERELHPSII